MFEQLPNSLNPEKAPETESKSVENREETNTATKPGLKIDIEKVKQLALEQPAPLESLPLDDSEEGKNFQYIDRAVKSLGLKKELSQIRQNLPATQKLFSKTVHQPIIRKLSNVSAQTITRPYGLLVGGIFAFLGSLAYLLFAKYIGIKYNYLLFIFLFLAGYITATLIELITKLIKQN